MMLDRSTLASCPFRTELLQSGSQNGDHHEATLRSLGCLCGPARRPGAGGGLAAMARSEPRRCVERNRPTPRLASRRAEVALSGHGPRQRLVHALCRQRAHLSHLLARRQDRAPHRPQRNGRQKTLVEGDRQGRAKQGTTVSRPALDTNRGPRPRLCAWLGRRLGVREPQGYAAANPLAQEPANRFRRHTGSVGLCGIAARGRRRCCLLPGRHEGHNGGHQQDRRQDGLDMPRPRRRSGRLCLGYRR
jgi:hypothetical protein